MHLDFLSASQKLKDRSIINYVWINKDPDTKNAVEKSSLSNFIDFFLVKDPADLEKEDGPLCSVPLRAFDKAFENARRYPNAKFQIWVDYLFLNDSSRFFLQSHVYMAAPDNVRLCDINDIPSYAARRDIFAPEADYHIWSRVDLARLLVVDHCLKKAQGHELVVYADFDIEDVRLDSLKLKACLEKYGFIFGATRDLYVENSFMAFRTGEGENFLHSFLLPSTVKQAEWKQDGYMPMCDSLKIWGDQKGFDGRSRDISLHIARGSGYQIPENPFYIECGVN